MSGILIFSHKKKKIENSTYVDYIVRCDINALRIFTLTKQFKIKFVFLQGGNKKNGPLTILGVIQQLHKQAKMGRWSVNRLRL